jgi:hypothetical protein
MAGLFESPLTKQTGGTTTSPKPRRVKFVMVRGFNLLPTILTLLDSNEEAYQGIEKHMFYCICRFLALNTQLILLFDGPIQRREDARGVFFHEAS